MDKTYAIRLTFICGEDIKKYLENKPPLSDICITFHALDECMRIISVGAVKVEELEKVPTLLDL